MRVEVVGEDSVRDDSVGGDSVSGDSVSGDSVRQRRIRLKRFVIGQHLTRELRGLRQRPRKEPQDPWDSVHCSWLTGPEAFML